MGNTVRKCCYNCKYQGNKFKLGGTIHHHCEHPKWGELHKKGKLSPYDTVVPIFSTCNDHEFKPDTVVLPSKLTAENGAKALLIGEFHEIIKIDNPAHCGCGECDYCAEFPESEETIEHKVPVSWDTIKSIYNMIVTGLAVKI